MVKYCVAYGCKELQRKGSNIQFHRFPFSRPEVLEKWCRAISRQKWIPSASSRICSKHFTDDCYQLRPGAPLRLLKESAVPSVFDFPNHLQIEKEVRRQIVRKILATSWIKSEAETALSDIPEVNKSEKMAVTSKNKAVVPIVPRRRSARIPARGRNKCTNLPRRRRESTTQTQKTQTELTETCPKDVCAAVKKQGQPSKGSNPKESSLKRKAQAKPPCKKSVRISEKMSRKSIKKEDDLQKLQKSLEEETHHQDGEEDKGNGGLVKGDCAICNNYTDNGTVLDSQTLTSKMHFYQKLIKVTAEENEVMVSEEGVLCSICTRLLNYMDRIEMELSMLKTAIINCLRKKCTTEQKACRTDQDHHEPGEDNKMVILHNSTEVKDDVENVSDHWQQTSDVQDRTEPKPVHEAHHHILEKTDTQSDEDKITETECEVPRKQYNCNICSFTTIFKSMIIFHLRQHVKDSFRCDFCNITISENFEKPLKMSTLRHLRYKRTLLPLPTGVISTVPVDSARISVSSGAAVVRKKNSKC